MQIDRIYYPVETLGYGKRIGIWTVGCTHECMKCSNPELWKSNPAKEVSIEKVLRYIENIPHADGVTITGGDPFLQVRELLSLVVGLRHLGYKDLLVYSGYTLDELKKLGETANQVLSNIGVLVDGRYVDELNDNKSFRGSSNQKIIVLDKELEERYSGAENWERKSQIVMNDNNIQAIGLPMK